MCPYTVTGDPVEENEKENRNNDYYSPDLYYVSLVIMRFFLLGVEVQTIDLHVDRGTLDLYVIKSHPGLES